MNRSPCRLQAPDPDPFQCLSSTEAKRQPDPDASSPFLMAILGSRVSPRQNFLARGESTGTSGEADVGGFATNDLRNVNGFA